MARHRGLYRCSDDDAAQSAVYLLDRFGAQAMTPPHSYNLKRRLNFILSRGALAAVVATIALCQSGCFAPFIPLAIQGVGMLGKAIGIGAEAGTMVKHGDDANPEEA